jgi:hypothetical protein
VLHLHAAGNRARDQMSSANGHWRTDFPLKANAAKPLTRNVLYRRISALVNQGDPAGAADVRRFKNGAPFRTELSTTPFIHHPALFFDRSMPLIARVFRSRSGQFQFAGGRGEYCASQHNCCNAPHKCPCCISAQRGNAP